MALFLLTVNFIFPINQNFLHKYEICSALFVMRFSFSYQAIFLPRFLHQHKIYFLPQAAAAPSVLLDSMSPGLKVRETNCYQDNQQYNIYNIRPVMML